MCIDEDFKDSATGQETDNRKENNYISIPVSEGLHKILSKQLGFVVPIVSINKFQVSDRDSVNTSTKLSSNLQSHDSFVQTNIEETITPDDTTGFETDISFFNEKGFQTPTHCELLNINNQLCSEKRDKNISVVSNSNKSLEEELQNRKCFRLFKPCLNLIENNRNLNHGYQATDHSFSKKNMGESCGTYDRTTPLRGFDKAMETQISNCIGSIETSQSQTKPILQPPGKNKNPYKNDSYLALSTVNIIEHSRRKQSLRKTKVVTESNNSKKEFWESSCSSENGNESDSDWEDEYIVSKGENLKQKINKKTPKSPEVRLDKSSAEKNVSVEHISEEIWIEEENFFIKPTFQCGICLNLFDSKIRFQHHKGLVKCGGKSKKKNWVCETCGKSYKTSGYLKDHINSHTNKRPYKCTDCEKDFGSKGTLWMHVKSMHLNIKSSYLCCYCGMTSVNLPHLKAHEATHLDEGTPVPTPFKCVTCGREFISNYLLIRHQNKHNIQTCPKCKKRIQNTKSFEKHISSCDGTGRKMFQCTICGKSFYKNYNLKCHMNLIHSNILKFFCDICDKGFKAKHLIEQHMITHSQERPIACPECSNSFKRQTHLKQHLAAVHGKKKKR